MSPPTATLPSIRLTADKRRDAVIAAAAIEFAQGGLAGTSTDAIARRAGVSQPYLFQLFGTKKELFIAVIRRCFERTTGVFQVSGRDRDSEGNGRRIRRPHRRPRGPSPPAACVRGVRRSRDSRDRPRRVRPA